MNETELSRVDLNLLVVLDVLLEEESLTAAGRRLGRTPSAMSHSLGRLRDVFQDELFVRSGTRIVPTAGAESLRAPLRAALEGVGALLRRGPFDPLQIRRTFRILASDYLQEVVLPPAVRRLRQAAPGVDLRVEGVGAGVTDRLAQDEADLALGVSYSAPESLRSRTLGTDRFVSLCREGAWRGAEGDAAAFAALPHVLVAPGGARRGPVDTALAALGLSRRVMAILPGFAAAAALLPGTDLVLTLPERLARSLVRPGLAVHPTPVAIEPFRLLALWHPRAHADPVHRWLRDTLQLPEGADVARA